MLYLKFIFTPEDTSCLPLRDVLACPPQGAVHREACLCPLGSMYLSTFHRDMCGESSTTKRGGQKGGYAYYTVNSLYHLKIFKTSI